MDDFFQNIDNWTLIKYTGGITVVLSSLIAFISHVLKDFLLNKWKLKYDTELESLKAKFSKNNTILENLTGSLSNVYLASNEKRIESLEAIWTGMLRVKNEMPVLVSMAYNILTPEEIENLPNTNKFNALIDAFEPINYFEKHSNLIHQLELSRPFIGETLWSIFFTYQAFIGRSIFLIKEGLEQGKVTHWKNDSNFINQILTVIIEPEELEKLTMKDKTAYSNVLSFLESKALNDISEQLTGKKMTDDTLSHAIMLNELTKKAIFN
ncbi:hypothetical protein [Cytophaga sp. FL35]|uniref:hypothetical protein n=1 Tax=Cytophaga sp. FL35 TaxID=1904456 RepID=UPI0016537C5A|nr:hypothetical protein [Cytophaga sp. FL35]MBC7000100.1 hypothetical protein [Cytophaga sp. FL35]